jgi:hypothetical protein
MVCNDSARRIFSYILQQNTFQNKKSNKFERNNKFWFRLGGREGETI